MSNNDESKSSPMLADMIAHDLVARVEGLKTADLDALPFGVIRLDDSCRVTYFSKTEATQSGFGDRNAIGLHFFTELAPCMASQDFQRQVHQALATRTLDIVFEQVGDFDDAERELRVRATSASTGGLWIFIERPRGSNGDLTT